MTTQDVNKISIRLLPDGFSYLNQFHHVQPGADFIQRLEDALLEVIGTLDEADTPQGVCSVENVRFCLSPKEMGEDIARQMYKLCIPTSEQDEELLHLEDERQGIWFTFGIDSQLYRFLLRNFPDLSYTHPLFELIQQWIDKEEVQKDCMVAEAGKGFLNLLIFKGGKLQVANRFETEGTDNILYHIMNCWTQYELDVIDHILYLNTKEEELLQNIGQYIKQCEL